MSVVANAIAAACPPDYRAKQVHRVPRAPSVDRMKFLGQEANGKVVVDCGASGDLSELLKVVAKRYHGFDREPGDRVTTCDFETVETFPPVFGAELVIVGEVLEHLSNPGLFLDRLRAQFPVRTIVTVPNAFSQRGWKWLAWDLENVNREHVAYYSYRTLRTLLERHGYRWRAWGWYRGSPPFADGLIAVVE